MVPWEREKSSEGTVVVPWEREKSSEVTVSLVICCPVTVKW